MITPADAQNLFKASRGASALADDLRALAQSSDPFLAELSTDMLKAAVELEQRLKRLETAGKTER